MKNLLLEIRCWLEFLINGLPGKIGFSIRRLYYSFITQKEIINPRIQRGCIIECSKNILFGKDIYLGYSYERIMPGKDYMDSLVNNYRCYAGMNKTSGIKCRNFLKKFINFKKFPIYEFDNLLDCEAAKVLENSYRAVNIAFIDEWTKFSLKSKLNLNKIIDAIKYRPTHNNIMRPGLGVGGYCLTKDPNFINFSGKYFFKKKFNFPITDISMKINR